jgi:hypothetical protein
MDNGGSGNNYYMAIVSSVWEGVIWMIVRRIIAIRIRAIIISMRVPQVRPQHDIRRHPDSGVVYSGPVKRRIAGYYNVGRIISPLNFDGGYFLIRSRTIHHRQRKSAHVAFSIFSDMDVINIAGTIEVKIIYRPRCIQLLFYLRRVFALFYNLGDGL